MVLGLHQEGGGGWVGLKDSQKNFQGKFSGGMYGIVLLDLFFGCCCSFRSLD